MSGTKASLNHSLADSNFEIRNREGEGTQSEPVEATRPQNISLAATASHQTQFPNPLAGVGIKLGVKSTCISEPAGHCSNTPIPNAAFRGTEMTFTYFIKLKREVDKP